MIPYYAYLLFTQMMAHSLIANFKYACFINWPLLWFVTFIIYHFYAAFSFFSCFGWSLFLAIQTNEKKKQIESKQIDLFMLNSPKSRFTNRGGLFVWFSHHKYVWKVRLFIEHSNLLCRFKSLLSNASLFSLFELITFYRWISVMIVHRMIFIYS